MLSAAVWRPYEARHTQRFDGRPSHAECGNVTSVGGETHGELMGGLHMLSAAI